MVENLNCEDLENLEKSKDRAGSLAQEIKSSMSGDSKNLKTWSGFVSYEFTYLALMFLELFWCRLDTIIASFYFTQTEIAVQSSFTTLLMFVDCFAYGFGMATAALMSKTIVQLKVKTTKQIAIISHVTIMMFGALFTGLLWSYN